MTVTAPANIDEVVSNFNSSFGLSRNQLDMMMKIYSILSQKYDVVCTDPPYMGGSNMNAVLSDFVKKNFADSKSNLFFVPYLIQKCLVISLVSLIQRLTINQEKWRNFLLFTRILLI